MNDLGNLWVIGIAAIVPKEFVQSFLEQAFNECSPAIIHKRNIEAKSTLFKELYTVTKLSAENHAFFGELALVDNDKRSATVVAHTDCELLVMKKAMFLKMGDQNPTLGLSVYTDTRI